MIKLEKTWKDVYITQKSTAALLLTIPGPFIKEFSKLLQTECNGTLLDLGCGYGNYLSYFSNLGLTVIGSDFSIVALKVAHEHMMNNNHVGTSLILHDMHYLPFCAESFNGLISINVIYHSTLDNVKHVVNEIYRVLKPGKIGLITLLSDTDFKYDKSCGTNKKSYRVDSETENGITHSFFNRHDIEILLNNFEIICIEKFDQQVRNQLSSHWVVLFQKNT